MSESNILDNINSPSDIKNLSEYELEELADELRTIIVETVSKNGGHLASNLGVVELTLAIHKVFDMPADKIVWDVGHQCYAHKIITGRKDKINTIRKEGGLSGFPKRSESVYDNFDTGHSSTSISAAFGISCGADIAKDSHYTVAVIGDGALSGGLAYEGLNNAGRYKKNFIVILNDNKMSISKNVGSMARYLSKTRIAPRYLDAKSNVQSTLDNVPVIGKPIANGMRNTKNWVKNELFGHRDNIFEQMGFTYYGPYDGHNIEQLVQALEAAKRRKGPVLVHVCTKKGKGYEFAEKDPTGFHGISSFDIDSGEPLSSSKGYSYIFGKYLCRLADKDKRICAITAAMKQGTGLEEFSKKHKDRFFDVGIAEEHAVTFAGGLATDNVIPVFAVYSTFLQRAYDQIIHDAALQGLHVVLAIDRAGIVGEDGETHQGIFDTAFLNTIPNVTVYAPSSFAELENMLDKAILDTKGTVAVRYPRGSQGYLPDNFEPSAEPYSVYGDVDSDDIIITYGRIFSEVCLAKNEINGKVCILKLNRIKPIEKKAVEIAMNYKRVYFFEEGIRTGGIGEKFGFDMYQSGFSGKYILTAIDGYVTQSTTKSALHKLGLDTEGIVARIKEERGLLNVSKKTS